MKFPDAERFHRSHEPTVRASGGTPMVALTGEGIDLFKIAGRSISGWIPSFKTGTAGHMELEGRKSETYLPYHYSMEWDMPETRVLVHLSRSDRDTELINAAVNRFCSAVLVTALWNRHPQPTSSSSTGPGSAYRA